MMMLDKMEENGLTQKAVAERMGCSQQYISRMLKDTENLFHRDHFKNRGGIRAGNPRTGLCGPIVIRPSMVFFGRNDEWICAKVPNENRPKYRMILRRIGEFGKFFLYLRRKFIFTYD